VIEKVACVVVKIMFWRRREGEDDLKFAVF
jgi:hypothetical protein